MAFMAEKELSEKKSCCRSTSRGSTLLPGVGGRGGPRAGAGALVLGHAVVVQNGGVVFAVAVGLGRVHLHGPGGHQSGQTVCQLASGSPG